MAQCLKGDQSAFDVLVARYEKPLFNVALRMLGDRDDARDVTQTAFLRAYESLRGFDSSRRFFSWLYRIAIHESLDVLGHRRPSEPLDDGCPATSRGPEEAAGGAELARLVQDALMGLSPDHRSAIVLRHYLQCSYREMADILGLPDKTVKSRLFEARRRLRAALVGRGLA